MSAPPARSTSTEVVHRPRPAPDNHLCTCGRAREDCVRDLVRALWRL